MDDDPAVRLRRQLIELAEHARAEQQRRPKPKPETPPERPRDEYGERMKGSGQVAPEWVVREVKAFLAARLAFDEVASPAMRWAAVGLQTAVTSLLLTPIDWEYRQDQGAAQHEEQVRDSVREFEEALDVLRTVT